MLSRPGEAMPELGKKCLPGFRFFSIHLKSDENSMTQSPTPDLSRCFPVDQSGVVERRYGTGKRWYAVFTTPRNEKSALKHLRFRSVECFVPTYELVRVWKNRQRVHVQLPLFPCYVFVRIVPSERGAVLACPGVVRFVGGGRESLSLSEAVMEFLRSDLCTGKVEPYSVPVSGERVRIRGGLMRGVEGVLVRRNDDLRFILTIHQINQHAAIEISADDLEPIAS